MESGTDLYKLLASEHHAERCSTQDLQDLQVHQRERLKAVEEQQLFERLYNRMGGLSVERRSGAARGKAGHKHPHSPHSPFKHASVPPVSADAAPRNRQSNDLAGSPWMQGSAGGSPGLHQQSKGLSPKKNSQDHQHQQHSPTNIGASPFSMWQAEAHGEPAAVAEPPGLPAAASAGHSPHHQQGQPEEAGQPLQVQAAGDQVVAAAAADAGGTAPPQRTDTQGTDGAIEEGEEKYIYEGYGDIREMHPVRQVLVRIAGNPDFELLVILVIFANCVTLALFDPWETDRGGRNGQLYYADIVINTLFTMEMLIRMGALGAPWVISYLKEPWNLFDFFMVAIGWTIFIPESAGNTGFLRALRALRALRPLRTITRFESLRAVVVCFMEAVPLLGAVAGVLISFLFLYAVAAVQVFTDVYHNTCAQLDPVTGEVIAYEYQLRAVDDLDMYGCSGETDPSPSHFWHSLRTCPTNMTCYTSEESTALHVAGFDNVARAMLSDFQVLTLTSWGYMMYRAMDNTSPFASLYFISLFIIGAYFVMNLFLAVLKVKFAKAQTIFLAKTAGLGSRKRKNTFAKLFSTVKSGISSIARKQSEQSLMNSQLQTLLHSKLSASVAGSVAQSLKSEERLAVTGEDAGKTQQGAQGGDKGGKQTPRAIKGAGGPEADGSGKINGHNANGPHAVAEGWLVRYNGGDSSAGAVGRHMQGRSLGAAAWTSDTWGQYQGTWVAQCQQYNSGATLPPAVPASSWFSGKGRRIHHGRAGPEMVSNPFWEPAESAVPPVSTADHTTLPSAAAGVYRSGVTGNTSRQPQQAPPQPIAEGMLDLLRPARTATNMSLGGKGGAGQKKKKKGGVHFGGDDNEGANEAHTSAHSGTGAGVRSPGPSSSGVPTGDPPPPAVHQQYQTQDTAGTTDLSTLIEGMEGPDGDPTRKQVAGAKGAAAGTEPARGSFKQGGHHAENGGPAAADGNTGPPAHPEANGHGPEGAAPGGGGPGLDTLAPHALTSAQALDLMTVQEFDEFVATLPVWQRVSLRVKFRLRKVAEHRAFNNIMMLAILASTVMLAMEYDGMPEQYEQALWNGNYAVTSLFTVEVIIKLWGYGIWDYARDGFNVFDFLIVTLSWVEVILASVSGLNALRSMRALRILRALRVLRLIKMFKYIKGLRKIGEVLFQSFASFFAIAMLLALFWLVFTILGLHIFGGVDLPPPDHFPNFNSFMNSLVSTFNILNLENWNQQQYAVVRAFNWGAPLFFTIWIIIGKYTFLSLFLAVMLEAFEAKYDVGAPGGDNKGSMLSRSMSGLGSSVFGSMRSGMSALGASFRTGSNKSFGSFTAEKAGASPTDMGRKQSVTSRLGSTVGLDVKPIRAGSTTLGHGSGTARASGAIETAHTGSITNQGLQQQHWQQGASPRNGLQGSKGGAAAGRDSQVLQDLIEEEGGQLADLPPKASGSSHRRRSSQQQQQLGEPPSPFQISPHQSRPKSRLTAREVSQLGDLTGVTSVTLMDQPHLLHWVDDAAAAADPNGGQITEMMGPDAAGVDVYEQGDDGRPPSPSAPVEVVLQSATNSRQYSTVGGPDGSANGATEHQAGRKGPGPVAEHLEFDTQVSGLTTSSTSAAAPAPPGLPPALMRRPIPAPPPPPPAFVPLLQPRPPAGPAGASGQSTARNPSMAGMGAPGGAVGSTSPGGVPAAGAVPPSAPAGDLGVLLGIMPRAQTPTLHGRRQGSSNVGNLLSASPNQSAEHPVVLGAAQQQWPPRPPPSGRYQQDSEQGPAAVGGARRPQTTLGLPLSTQATQESLQGAGLLPTQPSAPGPTAVGGAGQTGQTGPPGVRPPGTPQFGRRSVQALGTMPSDAASQMSGIAGTQGAIAPYPPPSQYLPTGARHSSIPVVHTSAFTSGLYGVSPAPPSTTITPEPGQQDGRPGVVPGVTSVSPGMIRSLHVTPNDLGHGHSDSDSDSDAGAPGYPAAMHSDKRRSSDAAPVITVTNGASVTSYSVTPGLTNDLSHFGDVQASNSLHDGSAGAGGTAIQGPVPPGVSPRHAKNQARLMTATGDSTTNGTARPMPDPNAPPPPLHLTSHHQLASMRLSKRFSLGPPTNSSTDLGILVMPLSDHPPHDSAASKATVPTPDRKPSPPPVSNILLTPTANTDKAEDNSAVLLLDSPAEQEREKERQAAAAAAAAPDGKTISARPLSSKAAARPDDKGAENGLAMEGSTTGDVPAKGSPKASPENGKSAGKVVQSGVPAPVTAAAGNGGKEPNRSHDGGASSFGGSLASGTMRRSDSMRSDNSLGSHGHSDLGSHDGDHHHHHGHKGLTPEQEYRRKMRQRNGAIMIEGSGHAFWLFDEDHPVRVWVYDKITTSMYDYIMITIIMINCLGMALESPYVEEGTPLQLYIYWSDVAFTTIFGLEVLVKSFAFTFRLYIKEVTNQVDLMIVVVSVLVIALEALTKNANIATALRVLRAIKPLRMLTRSPGMRMVFKSLLLSMSAMGNVSLVCLMFFAIFAILGTQLFMGLFWSCNDTSVAGVDECIGDFLNPATNTTMPREWTNAFPNFDNVGNSLLVCCITATLNGYTSTMIQAMSAPQNKGQQPQPNQNPGAFFWFLGFVLVCAFVLINLYVGVIFSQFSRIRLMTTTGSAFLTSQQQEWAELSKMVFRLKPAAKTSVPKSALRKLTYKLVNHRYFEIALMLVIVGNVVALATYHYDMGPDQRHRLDQANYFFVASFIAEALLKIYALGWRVYWKEPWHRFDLALVILGIFDIALTVLQANFLRVLRLLRVQRALRLLRAVRLAQVATFAVHVRSLLTTLLTALPAFGNVGALLGLFFFMYAYVGVALWGDVRWNVGINEHVNFRNFLMACSLLLRVATGDNWSNILLDCIPQPTCSTDTEINCGSWAAIPYFTTFVLLVSVILLSLFTAVIIETFEKVHEQEEWKLPPQALEEFVSLWAEYDDGTGTIAPHDLEGLLLKLEPPLGLGPFASSKDVLRFVYDLDIPLLGGRVPFHKTVFELVKRVSQSSIPEGALKEQLDRLVDKAFKHLQGHEALNFHTAVTVGRVQRQWRARMRAAKLRRRRAWRSARDDVPPYAMLLSEQAAIAMAYTAVKEATLPPAGEDEDTGATSVIRWRFSPLLTPWADELESAGAAGKKAQLKKIIGLFKSNKVAPASPSIGQLGIASPLLAPRTPKGGGLAVQKSENSGLAGSLASGQEGRVLVSPAAYAAAATRMKGE